MTETEGEAELKLKIISSTSKIFGFIAVIIIGPILAGFVIATLWGWFVTPWFNIRAISIPEAIGLDLLFTYMDPYRNPNDIKRGKAITRMIFEPIMVLLVGWIVVTYFLK